MAIRKEYEAAKREYHKVGNALAKASGSVRSKLKPVYAEAKREYHSLGRKLMKGK